MIRYALRCADDHRFEAWFASIGDFDRLKSLGHVTCSVCGAAAVDKDLMAPAVGGGREAAPAAADAAAAAGAAVAASAAASAAAAPAPAAPGLPAAARALADLRRRIEAATEDVGRNFVREARAIHAGAAPERPIRGEARPAEARALIEDGIPVAPLPPDPRKAN